MPKKSTKESDATAAAERPRRAPPPKPVEKAVEPAPKATSTTGKKRGRPAKAASDDAPAAKRAKAAAADGDAPRKRGRPAGSTNSTAKSTAKATDGAKKRGRPAKAAGAAVTKKTAKASSKKTAPAVPKGETAPPKKRGRPPKGGETTKITHDDSAAAEQLEEELNEGADQPEDEEELEESPEEEAAADEEQAEEEEQEEEEEPVSPRKRKASVPKPVASPAKSRVSKKEKTAKAAAAAEEAEASSSGRQFWLMKAEQESREETTVSGKTFDTKFTIDDLRAKGGPEPWDGVRNAVAAKNMRAMKKGDLAFFYASGGKAGRKPGIVGIMEVVREHEPDASTADKEHYAYVEKEADRARWCVVHVEYRKKLSKPVHLSVLQEHAKDGGPLSNIELLRLARLSVSRVSEREWDFITENLIEGYEHEIDSFDAAKASDGQEKDVPPSIFGPTVSAITEKVTEALHDVAAAVLPERDLLSPEPLTAGISSPLPQV